MRIKRQMMARMGTHAQIITACNVIQYIFIENPNIAASSWHGHDNFTAKEKA